MRFVQCFVLCLLLPQAFIATSASAEEFIVLASSTAEHAQAVQSFVSARKEFGNDVGTAVQSFQAVESAFREQPQIQAIQKVLEESKPLPSLNALIVETTQSKEALQAKLDGDPATKGAAVYESRTAKLGTDDEFNDFRIEFITALPVVATATQGGISSDAWHLRSIGADQTRASGFAGKGVIVAVVDSGLAFDHPVFSGMNVIKLKEANILRPASLPIDDNGHGTHCTSLVASQAYGVAPDVQILPVKTIDAAGSGSEATTIAGIQFAISRGAKVISVSLGWPASAANDPLWTAILDEAERQGVAVVIAGGNYSRGSERADNAGPSISGGDITVPGRLNHSGSTTVAATTRLDQRAIFSRIGGSAGSPTIAAPGEKVRGAFFDKGTGQNVIADLSGTSMATPLVAGCFATYMARFPDASLKNVIDRFNATVKKTGVKTELLGKGLIDVAAAHNLSTNPEPTPKPSEGGMTNSEYLRRREEARDMLNDLRALNKKAPLPRITAPGAVPGTPQVSLERIAAEQQETNRLVQETNRLLQEVLRRFPAQQGAESMPSAPTMQYSVSPVDESLGNPAELGGQATDLAPAPPVSSEEKAVEKFPAPKLDAGQPRVEESSEGELQSEAKSQQK